MTNRLRATVRRSGAAGVIDLEGDLDGDAADVLASAYEEAARDADRLVLSFERMEFMNSSGIALVVELLARARREGREVHAVHLSAHYQRIFEITRLSDFVRIHGSEADAVA